MAETVLHLSIDEEIAKRAKRYCADRGISLSRLVSDFLARLPLDDDLDLGSLSPITRRLYGIAAGGPDEDDYHRYLVEKYGQ